MIFTDLFLKSQHNEMTAAEKQQLNDKLSGIYGEPPVLYENPDNFEVCKRQLLTLLNYITSLDTEKLELFQRYHAKVMSLKSDLSANDVKVTLSSAKKSIEQSLVIIEHNYPKVDKARLNCLTVELCFPGAFSNIEYALGYFSQDSLDFLIQTCKIELLASLAQQYLNINKLIPHAGNEIHYVNTLFNSVAEQYGLPEKEDFFQTTQLLAVHFGGFIEYLSFHLSPKTFIEFFNLSHTPPNRILETAEDMKELDDYFLLFDAKGMQREKFLMLYDEDENDRLVPRDDFNVQAWLILALYLKEKGYIQNLSQTILDREYLFHESGLFLICSDGVWQKVATNDLITLLTEIKEYELKESLFPYLPAEDLFEYAIFEHSVNTERSHIYKALSAVFLKPQLPPDLIPWVMDAFMGSYDIHFMEKFAERVCLEVPAEYASWLVNFLNEKKLVSLFSEASRQNKDYIISALLPVLLRHNVKPDLILGSVIKSGSLIALDILDRFRILKRPGIQAARMAAMFGKVAILQRLQDLKIPLGEPDTDGNTPCHVAVIHNHVDAFMFFFKKTADWNGLNKYKCTPASYAAQLGRHSHIDALIKAGFNLKDETFSRGIPIVLNAAASGNIALLNLLITHGMDFQCAHHDVTPAYVAAMKGHLEFLDVLLIHNANIIKVKVKGLTIAHTIAKYHKLPTLKWLAEKDRMLLTEADNQGLRPLDYAIFSNQTANVQFLLNYPEVLSAAKTNNGYGFLNDILNKGNLPMLKDIFKAKPELLLDTWFNNSTIIHRAVELNQYEILEFLLNETSLSISAKTSNGFTALHLAVLAGDLKAVNIFYDYDESLFKESTDHGFTVAHLAVQESHIDILNFLREKNLALNIKDHLGSTVLHMAAGKENREILKLLHEWELDWYQADYNGMTPMHWALRSGTNIEILQDMHRWGINLAKKDYQGNTLAHFAAECGHIQQMEWLYKTIPALFQSRNQDGDGVAHIAAFYGQIEILGFLHKNRVSLRSANTAGYTCAHAAALAGHVHVIEKLFVMDPGVLLVTNKQGHTPMHLAARQNKAQVLTKLAELKICLDLQDNSGNTPAHYAAMFGALDALETLHKWVSLQAVNAYSLTPAHLAAANGHDDVIKKLIEFKISMNVKDNYGRSVLHKAAQSGHRDVIDVLLKHGVQDSADNYGISAAELALRKGFKEIAGLINPEQGHAGLRLLPTSP